MQARDHVLPDGTTVRLREIRSDDADRLLAMWERTSERSRRMRFHGPFELNPDNVERFVDLDPATQLAVVATAGRGDDERILGVARYIRDDDDPTHAEYAALVEDAEQGRGLGTALVREVARAAIDDGIQTLTGEILATNARMMRLVRDLGLDATNRYADQVVSSDFDLATTDRFLEVLDTDERRAAVAALKRFLRPESVAVVGASRDRAAIGGLLFDNLRTGGFQGVVYPVNPNTPHVQGVAAYASLADCPTVPDLVMVCVPQSTVVEVVDEAGQLGVRAVCVVSGGFAELGEAGRERQEELLAVARGHGMRIVGPNGMGLLNAGGDVRMNASFSTTFPAPGRLALSSQSGALGLAVLEHANTLGLGISTFVSVGNKADISGNDLLLYWEEDADTDVVLLYLESFGNPRKFSRIARRLSRTKPVVAVKSGRTRAGARAASSHTGALAAGDTAVDALFRQTGVIRTDTLEELFDVATLLVHQQPPRGNRVGVLTDAGGPATLAVDALSAQGLEVPTLSEATRGALSAVLPATSGTADSQLTNPIDLGTSATADAYAACLQVLAGAEELDAILVIHVRAGSADTDAIAEAIVAAAARAQDDVPVVAIVMNTGGVPPALSASPVPTFSFPEDAAIALGRVAEYGAWRERPLGEVQRPDDLDPDAARAVVEAAFERAGDETAGDETAVDDTAGDGTAVDDTAAAAELWLSTTDTEAVLRAYGIPLARAEVVSTPEQGAEAFTTIGVDRVAVKIGGTIRKADVGGLRLGLSSAEEVADAIAEVRGSLADAGLGEHAEAFVVQEMVDDGVEMVVGVTHDPSFGPLVMTGMGGTLVELHRDVAVRVTPLTDVDVDDMLDQLRMRPLLDGYRGSPARDVDALRDVLHRVGAMVEDLPEVVELDLNPVFVRTDGVMAVDVRCKVRPVP